MVTVPSAVPCAHAHQTDFYAHVRSKPVWWACALALVQFGVTNVIRLCRKKIDDIEVQYQDIISVVKIKDR